MSLHADAHKIIEIGLQVISELLCIKHHYLRLTCLATVDDVDFTIHFFMYRLVLFFILYYVYSLYKLNNKQTYSLIKLQ